MAFESRYNNALCGSIMLTRPYYSNPITSQFYLVKWGVKGYKSVQLFCFKIEIVGTH